MSFFSGSRQGNMPGPILGNPLNGLCEKAVIQTKKVFDACLRNIQERDVNVSVTFSPENPALPLTYTGCSASNEGITLSDVTVDRFTDKPCFARVTATANIPININYVDANGVAGVGTGTITVNNDVILYIPQPSIVPYQIEAFGSAMCADGDFVGENNFTIDACITLVIKVVVEADILVPTYGYAQIPPCQQYTQDVCTGFFDLPLFPAQQPVSSPNA